MTVYPPTCSAPGSVGAVVTTFAEIGGLLNTPGTHTAVFTALVGHLFADGATTKSVTYTIGAQLTGPYCDKVTPQPALFSAEPTRRLGPVGLIDHVVLAPSYSGPGTTADEPVQVQRDETTHKERTTGWGADRLRRPHGAGGDLLGPVGPDRPRRPRAHTVVQRPGDVPPDRGHRAGVQVR